MMPKRYDPFSRANQFIIDGTITGLAFLLAYFIRYEGAASPFHIYQFWVLLAPAIAAKLLITVLFRIHRSSWRYIDTHGATQLMAAYAIFSVVLAAMRYGLPENFALLRIPAGVIAIEFLLSSQASLGVRLLRRFIYERKVMKGGNRFEGSERRLILVGAGMQGSAVAKEMAAHPGIKLIGFLDDDARIFGTAIAGVPVLGPTMLLPELVRTKKIDEVLVCIPPDQRNASMRISEILKNLPITSRFVPTLGEILEATGTVRIISEANEKNNGNGERPIRNRPKADPAPLVDRVQGMNILITGGAGFIGTSLAEHLADENDVVLLDKTFERQPFMFTSLRNHRNVRTVEADIMQSEKLGSFAREADVVVHAAAIVGVERVCNYPRETLEVNFEGTSRVLRAVEKSARLKRFIYFSTSEVFGVNSFRVNENTPSAVGPAAEARWSYAIAKLAGEHLVKSYHRQVGLPTVTVRPFNIFGPRRIGANAILNFVLNGMRGEAMEVHGDGSQIRSWCYIDDFCRALVAMIARPGIFGEDFNIGNPTNTLTIYQLACRIRDILGVSVPIAFSEPNFPDIGIRVPSLEKSRALLDYEPQYDLDKGLALTIQWYREHSDFFETPLARAMAAPMR